MLNVRAFNKLLTANSDDKLFPRWFLMTTNGSLLAYTCPTNIRTLRDQAALVSLTWTEQLSLRASQALANGAGPSPSAATPARARNSESTQLTALTIETDKCNMVVRCMQPHLLLVLEGGVPPNRKVKLKVTAEPALVTGRAGEIPHDDQQALGGANGSVLSKTPASIANGSISAKAKNAHSSILEVHRRKLDKVATIILDELAKSGFQMPSESVERYS